MTEHQFTLGIPDGVSTLSLARNLSAINRRLHSSDANYMVSLRFTPLQGTADGLVQVSSAPNGWCNQSVWDMGARARIQFYEAMGIQQSLANEVTGHTEMEWPTPISSDNPYDEFRPYLDEAHFDGSAAEIMADGTTGVAGEWDYTTLGLFGADSTAPGTLDEAKIIFLGDHIKNPTPGTDDYRAIGLSELWLQNTNAPDSEADREPVLPQDTDNPYLMLFRGALEDQDEDAMTIINETNRTRPYQLDSVYDTLVLRGTCHMDTDSFSQYSVGRFMAMGGLLRFNNTTGQTVACTVRVHGL